MDFGNLVEPQPHWKIARKCLMGTNARCFSQVSVMIDTDCVSIIWCLEALGHSLLAAWVGNSDSITPGSLVSFFGYVRTNLLKISVTLNYYNRTNFLGIY